MKRLFLLIAVATLTQRASAESALLLVSLDGLRPDYITDADKHGLRIPHLRELMRSGAIASVRGVLPTSTYPSHTTILTGVWPAKHGIYSNKPFDPSFKRPDSWYWYSEEIATPTLWDAAAGAGYVVGGVSWPVSVGAKSVRFNIPEYNDTRTQADLKMVRALAGPALMDELGAKAGPYLMDIERAVERDGSRAKHVVEMIRLKHTRFVTVHLTASDHHQHANGPFHEIVIETIEAMDKLVGVMADAMRGEDANAVVCIVSDHGFSRVNRHLKLDAAFVRAGLMTLNRQAETVAASGVSEWTAMTWPSGGSAAIVMNDPSDSPARARVKALLDGLAADADNGIAAILDKAAIARLGGAPTAEFWVDMKPGFIISTALAGPISAPQRPSGTHGYAPTSADMNSTFLIAGGGIRAGVDLGVIDMRSIAPTLAKVLHVPFPTAELEPLAIFDPPAR